MLPEPKVLFYGFLFQAETFEGARSRFQLFVTDLVSVQHPTANSIAGPGGTDWGIDTFVGRLDDDVFVWQSKFFFPWKGEDQRKQVRSSFNEVRKKAESEGFTISAWTLCVPDILPPEEQQWWDRWSTKQRRQFGIRMALWNGLELRRRLQQPDAADVLTAYFPVLTSARKPEPIAVPGTVEPLSNALFVRQLVAAGLVETDSACGLFFAAEALASMFRNARTVIFTSGS